MPLVVLCDRSKVKDLHQVFGPVRRDLKKLMENGLTMIHKGVEIKLEVRLAFLLGDNLGVCEMLGMKRTFSSGFICRYCGLTNNELKTGIYETRSLNIYRSKQFYEDELKLVMSSTRYSCKFGITSRSCLSNLDLNIFQISPPDIFHDGSEGFFPKIACHLLKQEINSNSIVLNRINSIKWINGEIKIKKDLSLKGKGSQKFEFLVRMLEMFPTWVENPPQLYLIVRRIIFKVFSPTSFDLDGFDNDLAELSKQYRQFEILTPKSAFRRALFGNFA
uniref:Uncharacterized protein LOC113790509 n=1 Tax=Dermatophagoides pteronyssinus TaxID=6956 RepID=A0A6P6XT30_DERPT|nr:uncharacterized protein LOC113790509 [Dermatophagoides pteronyssinus]